MARAKQHTPKLAGKQLALVASQTACKTIPAGLAARPRFRPGSIALREIRKYQKTTDLLIRKQPFQRLVRSLQGGDEPLRFQAAALVILQETAENFLTTLLEDAYRCTVHAKRVTLMPQDIVLVYKIKNMSMTLRTGN